MEIDFGKDFTPEEAAVILGVTERTVQNHVSRGLLKSHKGAKIIGGVLRYRTLISGKQIEKLMGERAKTTLL